MSSFETFLKLHQGSQPFVLGNIWDVNSAKIFEASGYQAVGISSYAIATSFGYEDGEKLPFDILLTVAKRVTDVIKIPLSVDLEGGYSRSVAGILKNISKLHDTGVAGINLEDTVVGTSRVIQPVNDFKKILAAITGHIVKNNLKIFVNVRTDGFLLGMPTALAETLTRIKSYENAGASGIFVPCITDKDDIANVVKCTKLPVNVMCMPTLPDFGELGNLNVKRISMGPFLFNKVSQYAGNLAREVLSDGDFSSIL
jgi:2-methylisocitrate lyase-like PEP mutase family enzyme